MIVPMRKVYLIARQTDREPLLAILRELGIVHLVPVDPALAVPGEALSRQIDAIKQAVQVLSGIEPRGPVPEILASEAAHEALEIRRRVAEGRNHLAALYHQLEQIAVWDDLRLEHVEELRQAGVTVEFFAVPASAFGRIEAECVAEVGELSGREIMVAAVDRGGGIVVPEEARPMRLPSRDAAAIRAEAKQIDESLHRNINRLHELAQVTPALEAELLRLEQQAEETIAVRGAAADEDLFAVQGWLPAERFELAGAALPAEHASRARGARSGRGRTASDAGPPAKVGRAPDRRLVQDARDGARLPRVRRFNPPS